MIETITFNDFVEKFEEVDRSDQFTEEALELIFNYIEDVQTELDVIAICCAISELEIDEAVDYFNLDEDCKDYHNVLIDQLSDHVCSVIGITIMGTVVYID